MRDVTILFLDDGKQLCLGMKKRGFGKGKWNGFGGKIEKNESVKDAVVREMFEESSVRVEKDDLDHFGHIEFYFDHDDGWNQRMHVFFVQKWTGEPLESDEMIPRWFNKEKLPFEQMWIDDIHWLPEMLSGNKIKAQFHFTNEGNEILKHSIEEF